MPPPEVEGLVLPPARQSGEPEDRLQGFGDLFADRLHVRHRQKALPRVVRSELRDMRRAVEQAVLLGEHVGQLERRQLLVDRRVLYAVLFLPVPDVALDVGVRDRQRLRLLAEPLPQVSKSGLQPARALAVVGDVVVLHHLA